MSFGVTTKLICVFVFAYAKSRFSHDAAHINLEILKTWSINLYEPRTYALSIPKTKTIFDEPVTCFIILLHKHILTGIHSCLKTLSN